LILIFVFIGYIDCIARRFPCACQKKEKKEKIFIASIDCIASRRIPCQKTKSEMSVDPQSSLPYAQVQHATLPRLPRFLKKNYRKKYRRHFDPKPVSPAL